MLVLASSLLSFISVDVLAVEASDAAWNLSKRNDTDWPGVGGQAGEQHFSSLDQIDRKSIGRLHLAWSLDLPGEHTLEATPLAVGGMLYFTGQDSSVYAVEASSGQLKWRFNSERAKYRPRHLRLIFPVNRGVAYAAGEVFVGTLDGRLIALNAQTGKQLWSVKTVADDSMLTITGAPRVFKDKVVIGNGGGDAGQRGYVTAYYIATGEQAWRFYIVPGNPANGFEQPAMAMAAKTWSGEWWRTGTGGTAWDSMVYDSELNRLYIGTGNSAPYNPQLRNPGGGDNLFVCSIVAIDADSGRYIWHYQLNPNESWDYKATANIVMAWINVGGKPQKVLMQAPTNGFFYVLDRETGKLLSVDKLGKVTWADHIDLKTGRPVEAYNIRYAHGPIEFWPSFIGMHNWQPMSFSPATGLAYIPTSQLGVRWESDDAFVERHPPRTWLFPFASGALVRLVKADDADGTGALLAWDPVRKRARWRVHYPHLWNGGVLSTKGGLVFEGDGEGLFHAYDAATGKELWKFDAKLGIIGAPIAYSLAGTEYISVLVGFGGVAGIASEYVSRGWKYNLQPRRLLTFRLDGSGVLPPTPARDFSVAPLDDPNLVLDEAAVTLGAGIYGARCALCHGMNVVSSGVPGPDLRESRIALDLGNFSDLLRTGPLQKNGMPMFDDYSPEDIRAVYMYVRASARRQDRTVRRDAAARNPGELGTGGNLQRGP